MTCPCGSGDKFMKCCGKYIRGELAPTAEKLMRSRYSAYATGHVDYIVKTTHPDNPSAKMPAQARRKEIEAFCKNTTFEKLDVLDFLPGTPFATVTFHAHLSQEGNSFVLAEKSRFEKVNGAWLYLDGETA